MEKDMEKSFFLLESVLSPNLNQSALKSQISASALLGEKRSLGYSLSGSLLEEQTEHLSRPSFSKISKIGFPDETNLSLTTIGADEISKLWDYSDTKHLISSDLNNLYQQFQEALELHGNSQQVFSAISDFIEACSLSIEALIEFSKDGDRTAATDLIWLVNEKNTWQLVYALYRDRIFCQEEGFLKESEAFGGDHTLISGLDPIDQPLTEKEAMIELLNNESSVREAQLIIDWLERIAKEGFRLASSGACRMGEGGGSARVAHCGDSTVGWENTFHQLESNINDSSILPYPSTRELITTLDPDAPTRQGKSLHDLDIEDEQRLLEQIFFEIRQGCLDKAQEACLHCGQPWRAGTFEGWRLHHDPNLRLNNPNEKLPVEGNAYRDVWKLCAWRLCEDERVPGKLRATMGSLCGHLDSLLASCQSWEDSLWARVRVLVDTRVERAVRDAALRPYIPMPDKYWNNSPRSVEDIFRSMRGMESLSNECESPCRLVQELVSTNKVGILLSRAAKDWCNGHSSPQWLRFLAHLIAILRLLGISHSSDSGDQVLKTYSKVLMKEGNPKLVAFYVSMLPEEDQLDLYANFMESVLDSNKREECIKAAENYSLNIKVITKKVVQNMRDKSNNGDGENEEGSKGALVKETTESDLQKISSLDWVVYYPDQRAEAIWQGNALMRAFIGQGKLEAARKTFDKIPLNSFALISNQFNCKVDGEFRADLTALPPKVNSTIKEYLCLKAYLDAVEGFSDWFHNFHNNRPTAPPPLEKPQGSSDEFGDGALIETPLTNFTDKVAYEHKMVQYNNALERWKATMKHHAGVVKAQLYNVIIFPDSGWLVDDYEEDEARQNQLKMLRNYCLPEIVMLLHKVLHCMEEYEECLDLASLVMNAEYSIYKTFKQHQLSDLLSRMAESSRELLRIYKDPFGDFENDKDS